MTAQAPPYPTAVLDDVARWAHFLAEEWAKDFPATGSPQRWRDDLAGWLRGAEDTQTRHVTRAMRKLRRIAPREFEVAYRAIVVGESFEEIASWLNDRAIRNGIALPPGRPEHYRQKDAFALFMCAVEFVRSSL